MSVKHIARTVANHFKAFEKVDGVGANVRRSIGSEKLHNFTPFLMLDHFNVIPGESGFPSHPHHGQETITYITEGAMAHEDFTGAKGILYPGDLQFMTAGKGIVHSEIPIILKQNRKQPCIGLQLWVDLPEKLKNVEPRYRNLRHKEIPIAKPNDKVITKVISGNAYGIGSAKDLAYTPIVYYHYTIAPNGEFIQKIPKDFNSFLYLMNGSLEIHNTLYDRYDILLFNRDGDCVVGKNQGKTNADFILVGGQVLDQPIIQLGPFVETTVGRINQAFMAYEYGMKGFEKRIGYKPSLTIGLKEEDFDKQEEK